MRYILASASPRRKELLEKTGLPFEVIPSSTEEKITKVKPSDVVMELAEQKAKDVFRTLTSNQANKNAANASDISPASDMQDLIVIGADTIVVYKDEILGKPADKSEAYDMLSMLADRTHQVYTGVSLVSRRQGKVTVRTFFEKTDVTFYPINKEDLHRYVESGDSLDKAGAYGIQGDFAIHVKEIHGDYNNVVGLPIGRLYQELSPVF